MPEWLLSFCVNVCLLAGTAVSLVLLGGLIFIVFIELYDLFMGDNDNLDSWTEDDL